MMFARSFKKSFEQWWEYYYLKGLYGYSDEELREYTDYRPSEPEVERVKNRWYMSIGKNSGEKDDEIIRQEWDMGA